MRGFISFIVFPTFNDTVDHCNNDGSLNQEINSEPQLTFRSFTIVWYDAPFLLLVLLFLRFSVDVRKQLSAAEGPAQA